MNEGPGNGAAGDEGLLRLCWFRDKHKQKNKKEKQGRIHGIRCYETPFSAVKEKALRTDGWTDGRTDGWTDGQTDGRTLI